MTKTGDSMADSINPLLPSGYDVVWSAVAVAALTALVVALFSIGRDASLSPGQRLVWVLIALFVPIIGPAAWFLARPRTATQKET